MTVENPGCLAALVPVFKIVSQNTVMVIERLGRFHRLGESGVNILIPLIDRPRAFTYRFIEEDAAGDRHVVTRSTVYAGSLFHEGGRYFAGAGRG